MGHVRLDTLQRAAKLGGYAIPHFLGGTTEMVVAQIKAAEDHDSPVSLGFAPEVLPVVPPEHSFSMMVNAAQHARVPVATQLEHTRDYDTIAQAIRLGVSSVMFDGSDLPFDENIAQTQEIVKMAHAFGVAVEGELGSVGGSAGAVTEDKQSLLTDPELAVEFVARTGVDLLAISFGNVHGRYHATPSLDYDLVRTINCRVQTPLVMHGGSGLSAAEYRHAIKSGISNIHFYTSIALGVWRHLQDAGGGRETDPAYHEMVSWTIDHFYDETVHVIDILGSAGRAGAA